MCVWVFPSRLFLGLNLGGFPGSGSFFSTLLQQPDLLYTVLYLLRYVCLFFVQNISQFNKQT